MVPCRPFPYFCASARTPILLPYLISSTTGPETGSVTPRPSP